MHLVNFPVNLNIYHLSHLYFKKQNNYVLTTFEHMYETHKQCAQLLAVEGMLLLCNVHLNLPGGNIIQ